MNQNVVVTDEQVRHAAAIQNVVMAVARATDHATGGLDSAVHRQDFTRDVVSDPSRVNMLHPAIGRTSAVNCIKAYLWEISKPVIETMFIATDSRPLKHGSTGPRR